MIWLIVRWPLEPALLITGVMAKGDGVHSVIKSAFGWGWGPNEFTHFGLSYRILLVCVQCDTVKKILTTYLLLLPWQPRTSKPNQLFPVPNWIVFMPKPDQVGFQPKPNQPYRNNVFIIVTLTTEVDYSCQLCATPGHISARSGKKHLHVFLGWTTFSIF